MENNKLTPKQRAKIYYNLAKTYSLEKNIHKNDESSICLDLKSIFYGNKPYKWVNPDYNYKLPYWKVLQFFPEILMIIQDRKESFTQELRITALLFAYQMALDATD